MEKGQVTIEMIFIFGMFIMIIFAVSLPSVMQASRDAKDVQFISDAKFATDRLATYAGDILNPYEKKNVEVYIPGQITDANSAPPFLFRGVCIETDGRYLNTTTVILRFDSECNEVQDEGYDFSKDLGAGDWKIYIQNDSIYQEGTLIETSGRRYNLTISWENITSYTVPSYIAASCDDAEVVLTAAITDILTGACP